MGNEAAVEEEGLVDHVGPEETSEWISESTKAAAKDAAKEAEDAGVSPHAVMRSAPEGYATGVGDRWEGIHLPANKEEGHAGTGPDHPLRRAEAKKAAKQHEADEAKDDDQK